MIQNPSVYTLLVSHIRVMNYIISISKNSKLPKIDHSLLISPHEKTFFTSLFCKIAKTNLPKQGEAETMIVSQPYRITTFIKHLLKAAS